MSQRLRGFGPLFASHGLDGRHVEVVKVSDVDPHLGALFDCNSRRPNSESISFPPLLPLLYYRC